MRILYTGPLSPGETCEMRRACLERLGHETTPVDYLPLVAREPVLARKVQWRLRAGPMVERYNRLLVERLAGRPDLVWVDKGLFVHPETLERARAAGARVVHYSPDDYALAQNVSRHFWESLPLYDVVVTTKARNVAPLQARGARRVLLSGKCYAPEVHRPPPPGDPARAQFACDVSFIGRWEPEREAWLARVAALGVRLVVRGPRWNRVRSAALRGAVDPSPVWGADYARAIGAAKINLGLLSRLAGDLITARSIEIPACGGFLLAERTAEHQAHFAEGTEAAYFDGCEELLGRIAHYLSHEDERVRIAAAGRARCLASGYSYDDRLAAILGALEAPFVCQETSR